MPHFSGLWPRNAVNLNFQIPNNPILFRKDKDVCQSSGCSLLYLQRLNRYLQPSITMATDNHCFVPSLFFREKKRLEKAAVYLPITQCRIFGACRGAVAGLASQRSWQREGCFPSWAYGGQTTGRAEEQSLQAWLGLWGTCHWEMPLIVPASAAYKNKLNHPRL